MTLKTNTLKQNDFLKTLQTLFAQKDILTDAPSLQYYGQDSTKIYHPNPLAIVFPRKVGQLQQLVKLANQHLIGLTPSGGRTGLSGGATALNGELIVSFDRMNSIHNFNAIDQTITVDAGVITAKIQELAEKQGLYYPVDFASAGSSQIGGNIATNAGGIKVIRYGLTRNWILGLTVITGAGDLLQINHGLIKNATGYDLRHLFIGSEGTLGFISSAIVKLTRQPNDLKVMLIAINDMNSLMQLLDMFQEKLELTAFEFLSDKALHLVMKHHGYKHPLGESAPWYALIEFDDTHNLQADIALTIFNNALKKGLAIDGVISNNQQQAKTLWALREKISETVALFEPYKNDLAVTVSNVPSFLKKIEQLVLEHYQMFEVIWYGHIGDGNLHLNILKPSSMNSADFQIACNIVTTKIADVVKEFSGSISAEHGVGLLKRDYIHYSKSSEELAYMQSIKKIFDPNGIMNPGKLLPKI